MAAGQEQKSEKKDAYRDHRTHTRAPLLTADVLAYKGQGREATWTCASHSRFPRQFKKIITALVTMFSSRLYAKPEHHDTQSPAVSGKDQEAGPRLAALPPEVQHCIFRVLARVRLPSLLSKLDRCVCARRRRINKTVFLFLSS